MKAQLILENGKRFNGRLFGAEKEAVGEVVFTTGMVGYQEELTDPSFSGQFVVMTFPMVGNYGINSIDNESDGTYLKALVVREKCDEPSNFRCEKTLDAFLKEQGVVGIEGIDTRELTRILRNYGTMRAAIAFGEISDEEAKKRIDSLDNSNVVMEATTKEKYVYNESGKINAAYIDLGTKRGILEALAKRDCRLNVFPADASAEEILACSPEFVFVSSGPGDPNDAKFAVETVKQLVGKLPLFGICLGHHIIALALGCTSEKMKFGHHGGNHPVRNIETGKILITSQAHNHAVSNLPEDVVALYTNVNDGTCEGLMHKKLPIRTVQFHPEACPGPKETEYIFDEFLKEVEACR